MACSVPGMAAPPVAWHHGRKREREMWHTSLVIWQVTEVAGLLIALAVAFVMSLRTGAWRKTR
jgi:hypothetical protein